MSEQPQIGPEQYRNQLMAEWERLYDAKVRAATDYTAMMLWDRLPPEILRNDGPLAREHRERLAEDAALRWLEIKQQMHALDTQIEAAR
jgi:hypothetical protein